MCLEPCLENDVVNVEIVEAAALRHATPSAVEPAAQTMFGALLDFGVPRLLAKQAANYFPTDVNAALDWACSSERRRVRPHTSAYEAQTTIDVSTPSPTRAVGASSSSTAPLVPAVPSSWTCETPAAHSAAETAAILEPSHCEVEDPPSVKRMPPPCFLQDPEGEVHSWFCVIANSRGAAALDRTVWQRMPMYSQYIQEHTLPEIVAHSVASIREQRGMAMSIEQASRLPRVFGYTAILPLAVACEYAHSGCGLCF